MSTGQFNTEDYATILLHYENGARGVCTVAQICSGRKNRLFFEINGLNHPLSWNGENPNDLWIGHRNGPNQMLIKDPSLLTESARSTASYPGGHAKGSRILSNKCIRRSINIFWMVISIKHLIFQLFQTDIMRWYCVKQLNAVPVKINEFKLTHKGV